MWDRDFKAAMNELLIDLASVIPALFETDAFTFGGVMLLICVPFPPFVSIDTNGLFLPLAIEPEYCGAERQTRH